MSGFAAWFYLILLWGVILFPEQVSKPEQWGPVFALLGLAYLSSINARLSK